MSILSGKQILAEVEAGRIEIDPLVREHVNPASIDLTLGDEVLTFGPSAFYDMLALPGVEQGIVEMDVRKQYEHMKRGTIGDEGILIVPNTLYLMHTTESVYTKHFVPVLDGKSSLARIGVSVHTTAGYGDPGYRGQYTLEVTTVYTVKLYAGMRMCQMRFHELVGDAEDYQDKGHYTGEQRGPQPSRVHEQFK